MWSANPSAHSVGASVFLEVTPEGAGGLWLWGSDWLPLLLPAPRGVMSTSLEQPKFICAN